MERMVSCIQASGQGVNDLLNLGTALKADGIANRHRIISGEVAQVILKGHKV